MANAPRPTRNQLIGPVLPQPPPPEIPEDLPEDTIVKKLTSYGSFYYDKAHYMVGARHSFKQVLIITDGDTITVTDLHGEILIEHTRPAPAVTYVGNGQPRCQRPRTN